MFEVVEFNDKLSSMIELEDITAKNAENFFTKQCWSQLSGFLIEDFNKQHTLRLGNGLQEKTFALHVQHFSESIVAIILRAIAVEEKPYLQFIEQHVSPVLTTDLQGRIIHQNIAATATLSREQRKSNWTRYFFITRK